MTVQSVQWASLVQSGVSPSTLSYVRRAIIAQVAQNEVQAMHARRTLSVLRAAHFHSNVQLINTAQANEKRHANPAKMENSAVHCIKLSPTQTLHILTVLQDTSATMRTQPLQSEPVRHAAHWVRLTRKRDARNRQIVCTVIRGPIAMVRSPGNVLTTSVLVVSFAKRPLLQHTRLTLQITQIVLGWTVYHRSLLTVNLDLAAKKAPQAKML